MGEGDGDPRGSSCQFLIEGHEGGPLTSRIIDHRDIRISGPRLLLSILTQSGEARVGGEVIPRPVSLGTNSCIFTLGCYFCVIDMIPTPLAKDLNNEHQA